MMKFDAKRRDDTHRRRHRLSVRDVRPHINVTRNAKDTARQPSVFLRIRPNKMRLPSVLSSVDPTWCRLPVNVERPDTHTGGQFPLRSQCTYPPSSVFVCVWADQVRKSVVKQTHRHTEKQADKQTDRQTVRRNSAIRLCLIGPWLIRKNSAGRRLLCYVPRLNRRPRRNVQFPDSACHRRFLLLCTSSKFLCTIMAKSPASLTSVLLRVIP